MAGASTPTPPAAPIRRSSLGGGLAVALAAAALGYLAHHVPPLDEHAVASAVTALGIAALGAWGLAALLSPGEMPVLPRVVVASPGGATTRALTDADLDFCAALHTAALGHGFFTDLGPRFLRSYYATFVDSPHAVARVATVAGQPVGALVGILRPRAHVRWVIRRRGVLLALHAAAGLATRPGAALRFARTRVARYLRAWRRHRGADAAPVGPPQPEPAVLSHVAVVPGARGVGAGRTLVESFEADAREAGARRAILTTLDGPAGAGGFYAGLGWRRSGTQTTPDGAEVQQWVHDLEDA